MKNIKHLLDVVDKVKEHVALGLMSDPGLSKTSQVKEWAEDHGRRYFELIISQRMPSEISGMPMPVQETQKMEIFDFDTLLELKAGDVLAFDEFTNGNIQTLNACLTLIQERMMLSGKKLPPIIIVAMGNPQGRCDLLPQTKQRFWWVDVRWDSNTWCQYMLRTWNMTVDNTVLSSIEDQYRLGFKSQNYNYWTPRTIENLIRIAQKISINDDFWNHGDIPNMLVQGIYRTIETANQIPMTRAIRSTMLTWLDEQRGDELNSARLFHYNLLRKAVDSSSTWSDLNIIIEDIKNDGRFSDAGRCFVLWLESREVADLTYTLDDRKVKNDE